MGWAVERHREAPAVFHARALPDPVTRAVWVCDPIAPALVLGSGQRDDVVDRAACEAAGVDVVRRRSGGGAVLVEPGRLLWLDVLVPAGDDLWSDDVGHAFLWLGAVWGAALASLGIDAAVYQGGLCTTSWSRLVCFGGLGTGEVVGPSGAKLVGLSQRRSRAGARFQCAALVAWAPHDLLALLALDPAERAAAAADLADAAAAIDTPIDDLLQAFLAHLP